jgi:phosphoglycerol transferase MdoB-like AlkP superfamily enzyme
MVDLVFAVLAQTGRISDFVGIIAGIILIVSLYVITRLFARINTQRGRFALSLLSAVFIFLTVVPLAATSIAA